MAVRMAVDPNEDLDTLIANLKAQTSKDITLALPQETRALQTLDNFYALRNAVRSAGINLSITGGNKTIRGLAKLLGFAVDKEAGPDEDDGGAGEMFGNAPTAAPARTSFGLPEGFVVAQQGQAANPTAATPNPAPPRPTVNPPAGARSAADFLNEMRDFNPGLPTNPLQPPPAARGDFNGNGFGDDQVVTRENIPDFFGNAGGATATRQPPPPPKAEFDIEGGRTMSFEEATRNGLFSGGSLGLESSPLDDNTLYEDDVPAVAVAGGDTAADRFRGGRGVRNPDEAATGGRTRRRDRTKTRTVTPAEALGPKPAGNSVLNRVRKLIVPVEPRAVGTGPLMGKPQQSPEEVKRRNSQRNRTTLLTMIGVIAVIALLGLLLFLLLGSNGSTTNNPPVVAVTVPLKTQDQQQTVRFLLDSSGASSSVSGVNQVPSLTPGATASGAAASPGAATVAPTVSNEPARLPVTLVNTGDLRVASGPINSSGARNVPDKAASGPITFVNRGSAAVSYGAGTVIYTAPNGVVYRLVQGVTVGAGNVFSGAGGQGSGTVVADKAGPVGNSDQKVSRVLGVAVGLTAGPFTGGTDRQEKFVTQADLDNLKKQLQDKAKDQANSQIKYDPSTQATIVLKSNDPTCEFNKKVNDSADNFTGTCTVNVQAAIYDTKTLTSLVQGAFNKDPNFKLDQSTPIKLLDAQPQEEGGQRYVTVKALGRVIMNLDTGAFRDSIANKPKAELNSIISSQYPQVAISMMNFDAITKDSLPPANQLEIKTVPDYQMTATDTTPSGTASTTPSGTALPGGGNSLPNATRTAVPTK